MKAINSLVPIIQEFERIYESLNKKFGFNYPKPIIAIQTKGRQKNTLGWYYSGSWTNKTKKEDVGEITICAENLNKNPIETLIHEMAHHADWCEKIEDCNNAQYHNKHFKTKAENYGLNCKKMGRLGWANTSISERLQTILNDIKIKKEVFKLYRKQRPSMVAPTKMKKWKCSCTTVRCATDLDAICNICNKPFHLEN